MTDHSFHWTPGRLDLVFTAPADGPVVLSGLADTEATPSGATQPLVEVFVAGDGHARFNTTFQTSGVGTRLRYREHRTWSTSGEERLEIVQVDPATGLRVTVRLAASPELTAFRSEVTLTNDGAETVVVEAVSSFATGALVGPDESADDLLLYGGISEWLGENRWSAGPLISQPGLADVGSSQAARGEVAAVSTSTWSTGRVLPTGVLQNSTTGRSLGWQIEHNGGWRWEVDSVRSGEDAVAVVLLGPEDLDHHWSEELAPGDSFTTVPVSVAISVEGFEGVLAELTGHRRWLRRAHGYDRGSLLVFNDYMNTLNGDPTTERLLPLIEAARQAGAECFCIDAGWYDDTEAGDWWPSVGAWEPSVRRFPDGGLDRVLDVIRDAGMTPGLWLEPEVIGVQSPMAQTLPDAAFLQRHGRRVREHDRFFLDLRHPAARDHLDATFERLISAAGVGFFKLDYNVTPGPGTDHDAFSVGAGLLAHNRAHLDWFAALRRRHPTVVFENCSSGAMRADFAMLECFDFQSTSDQEDFRRYPVVAAAAPIQMLPEQAGNWAYPQAWMNAEEIAFTMVTGLSGRLYLSGFLNRMDADQLALVHDATAAFKAIRPDIAASVPSWPLDLPEWSADAVSLTLTSPARSLVYVWHRGDTDAQIPLRLDARASDLVELYPRRLTPWQLTDAGHGYVLATPGQPGPSARLYEIPR